MVRAHVKRGALHVCKTHIYTYVLAQHDPAETFEEACDSHHDAEDVDTKAVAIILFDKKEFDHAGLQHSTLCLSLTSTLLFVFPLIRSGQTCSRN